METTKPRSTFPNCPPPPTPTTPQTAPITTKPPQNQPDPDSVVNAIKSQVSSFITSLNLDKGSLEQLLKHRSIQNTLGEEARSLFFDQETEAETEQRGEKQPAPGNEQEEAANQRQKGSQEGLGGDEQPEQTEPPQKERETWASKLCSKGVGKAKLRYIPPTMVNGEPVVHLQSTQFRSLENKNANLVIGTFLTSRPSFDFVQNIVKGVWKPSHAFKMKPYGRKSYSFEFENEDDRAQALEMGNYHIASQLFLVRPWKLFVEADLKNMETLPIWVLFKKVPEELRDDDGYSRIASAIGEPLFTDRKTEMKANPEYARICIEVKASSSLPKMVPVVVDKRRVFHIEVEYNWKPPNCKYCKVFGHNEHTYSRAPKAKNSSVWVQKAQEKGKTSKEGDCQPEETNEGRFEEAIETLFPAGSNLGDQRNGNAEKESSIAAKSSEGGTDNIVSSIQPTEHMQETVPVTTTNSFDTFNSPLGVAGVKLLSSSDAVPDSLNGIIEEVDLVNKRMEEFLKGNAQSAPLSSPSRTPLGKKRFTAVSLASRKSQRNISAPERLDL